MCLKGRFSILSLLNFTTKAINGKVKHKGWASSHSSQLHWNLMLLVINICLSYAVAKEKCGEGTPSLTVLSCGSKNFAMVWIYMSNLWLQWSTIRWKNPRSCFNHSSEKAHWKLIWHFCALASSSTFHQLPKGVQELKGVAGVSHFPSPPSRSVITPECARAEGSAGQQSTCRSSRTKKRTVDLDLQMQRVKHSKPSLDVVAANHCVTLISDYGTLWLRNSTPT